MLIKFYSGTKLQGRRYYRTEALSQSLSRPDPAYRLLQAAMKLDLCPRLHIDPVTLYSTCHCRYHREITIHTERSVTDICTDCSSRLSSRTWRTCTVPTVWRFLQGSSNEMVRDIRVNFCQVLTQDICSRENQFSNAHGHFVKQ